MLNLSSHIGKTAFRGFDEGVGASKILFELVFDEIKGYEIFFVQLYYLCFRHFCIANDYNNLTFLMFRKCFDENGDSLK